MNTKQKLSFTLLRIALGWIFFYAGITSILNPKWTALAYLKGAQTLSFLYQWLALPQNITWVNLLNKFGLTLIGISMILGLFTRIGSIFGMLLMVLFYLPILKFPLVGTHSFLVDEHVIYFLIFFLMFAYDGGKVWGLDSILIKAAKKFGRR